MKEYFILFKTQKITLKMKQPSAPNLYPELSTEDQTDITAKNYRLQKISEIEKTLLNEIEVRKSLYKKYKRGINLTDGVDTTLISGGVIMGGIGLATPLTLPLEILAISLGTTGVCVTFIRRKLFKKAKKHDEIKMLAESKLNSIKDLISKSLIDGQISETEFKMILDEEKKYFELKKEIKNTKNLAIDEEEKKKLIEKGKKLAMSTINKSLKTA